MKYKILLVAGLLFLMSGCGKTVLTETHKGKYKSLVYKNESTEPSPQDESRAVSPIINRVAVVPLEPQPKEKPEKALALIDYSQSVSKEIIKAYASIAGKNGSEFIKLMKEPLSVVEKSESQQTDYTKVSVRLNFTFVNAYLKKEGLHHPNTRIEYLNTTVTPKSSNFFFYNVDKFQNVVKSVDVGTLSRTQNVKFGAELSGSYGAGIENTTGSTDSRTLGQSQANTQNRYDAANNPVEILSDGRTDTVNSGNTSTGKNTLGLSASAKANYENAVAINENANLRHDILSTGYSFDSNHLTVMKRGFPLNEIPNETFVTTTLKFKNAVGNNAAVSSTVFNARGLHTTAGKTGKADEIVFKSKNINYNRCSDGNKKISLAVTYDGMMRVVENRRGNNKGEFDDFVTYQTFENIRIPDIELDLNDFCSKVYKVMIREADKQYTLYIKSDNSQIMQMRFFQDDNYLEFIDWLQEITSAANFNDLKTSKYILYFSCTDYASESAQCPDIEVISSQMNADKLASLKKFLKGKTIYPEEIK